MTLLIDRAPTAFVDHALNQRLSENVQIGEGGCLLWTGARAQGYGRLNRSGKSQLVHRLAYELVHGPIPDGLDLDHLCRNRACFNPDHLEPVTRSENVRRGHPHRQRKTTCPHGHLIDGDNAREVLDGGRTYLICVECRRRSSREWARQNQKARRHARRQS